MALELLKSEATGVLLEDLKYWHNNKKTMRSFESDL